jgi:hypothetical protein
VGLKTKRLERDVIAFPFARRLSYRSAAIQTQQDMQVVMETKTIQAASATLQHLAAYCSDRGRVSAEALTALGRADAYFYRIASRLVALRTISMSGRTADLTGAEADRCHGYVEHLFHVVMQQRSLLADMGREMRDLQSTLAAIRRLDASARAGNAELPAQSALHGWLTSQLEAHERLVYVVDEARIVLTRARPPVDGPVLQAVCAKTTRHALR